MDISTAGFSMIPHVTSKIVNMIIMVLNLFVVLPQLLYTIIRRDIKLLHSNRPDMHIPAIIAAKLTGIPVIAHDHLFLKSLKHRIIDFICGLFSDRIISVSQAMKDQLNIPKRYLNKVIIVHNGIDVEEFRRNAIMRDLRVELNIRHDQIILGMLTRLSPEKGLEYLIEGFHLIKQKHPNVKLIIAGDVYSKSDEKYKAKLLNLIARLNLSDDVIMPGYCGDIKDMISIFDIAVSSSLAESFGMFVLESMMMGKPVVATDVGGVSEVLLDSQTGIIIKPRDPESLKDALFELIKDRKKAFAMGKRGMRRATDCFNVERTTRELENIYKDLMCKQPIQRITDKLNLGGQINANL
jgi:glycosyltransferase involved in cell wall biosynthesis